MKRIAVISAVMASAVIAGCTNENSIVPESLKEVTLHADATGVRTALQTNNSVWWEAGDEISVFDGTDNYKLTTFEAGASVDFTGSVKESLEGLEGLLAIYPYSATKKNSGNLDVTFPHVQVAQKADTPSISNILVGKIDAKGNVSMKNLGGLVKFTISTSDITSVTFIANNGEWMAGPGRVSFEGDEPVIETTGTGHQYSSIVVEPEGQVFEPGDYYFAVPATTFSKGVTLRFTRSSDKFYAEAGNTAPLTINRSRIRPLETVDANLSWSLQAHLSFVDCAKKYAESKSNEEVYSGTLKVGEVSEFVTLAEGYTFKVLAANSCSKIGGSSQGFKFGKSETDYLELPSFGGYGLSKVVLVSGNYNNSNVVTVSLAKASDSSVVGESWTNNVSGARNTWSLSGASNEAYRLVHADGQNLSIQQLHLYYSEVESGPCVVSAVANGTAEVFSETGTTATLKATVTAENFSISKCECGFEYKKFNAEEWASVPASSSVEFSAALTGLEKDVKYNCRAWAKGSGNDGKVYGEEADFTPRGETFTIDMKFAGDGHNDTSDIYGWTDAKSWGLSTKAGNVTSTKESPAEKTLVIKGNDYEFSIISPNGYGFRVASSIYYGLCLCYCGSGLEGPFNGALLLPSIPGMKLTGVSAIVCGTGSTDAAAYDFTVASAIDENCVPTAKLFDFTVKCATSAWKTPVKNDLNGEENKRYYICTGTGLSTKVLTGGRNATIQKLSITYSKCEEL